MAPLSEFETTIKTSLHPTPLHNDKDLHFKVSRWASQPPKEPEKDRPIAKRAQHITFTCKEHLVNYFKHQKDPLLHNNCY